MGVCGVITFRPIPTFISAPDILLQTRIRTRMHIFFILLYFIRGFTFWPFRCVSNQKQFILFLKWVWDTDKVGSCFSVLSDPGQGIYRTVSTLSLIHISEPTRLGMIS